MNPFNLFNTKPPSTLPTTPPLLLPPNPVAVFDNIDAETSINILLKLKSGANLISDIIQSIFGSVATLFQLKEKITSFGISPPQPQSAPPQQIQIDEKNAIAKINGHFYSSFKLRHILYSILVVATVSGLSISGVFSHLTLQTLMPRIKSKIKTLINNMNLRSIVESMVAIVKMLPQLLQKLPHTILEKFENKFFNIKNPQNKSLSARSLHGKISNARVQSAQSKSSGARSKSARVQSAQSKSSGAQSKSARVQSKSTRVQSAHDKNSGPQGKSSRAQKGPQGKSSRAQRGTQGKLQVQKVKV